MALLPDLDRARTAAQWMRDSTTTLAACTKTNLRDALNATDQWIDDNQTAFNTALPVTFRTNATLQQKTLLFCYVAMRRAGILKAQEDG